MRLDAGGRLADAKREQETPMAGPAKRSSKVSAKAASGGLAALIAAAAAPPAWRQARAQLDEWLGEIARSAAGKTLKSLLAADARPADAKARAPALAGMIAEIADGSPYLWDLIRAEPERFLGVLEADPEAHFATLIAAVDRAGLTEADEGAMMRALRRGKAEAALLIALADIGGVWPVERVTRALTEFADAAVGAAVRFLLRARRRAGQAQARRSGRSPRRAAATSCSPWARWARTSSTTRAISTSSCSTTRARPRSPGAEPAALFVRLTRGLVKLLQERTADGYVFRTDLRLRPDPGLDRRSRSRRCPRSNYYESTGQNWERAAMIKARPCAGDIAAGESVPEGTRRRSSGANISTTPRSPTCMR